MSIKLSKYTYSIMERRVLYLIIAQIKRYIDKDPEITSNMFGDVLIRIFPNQLIKQGSSEGHIRLALGRLMDKTYQVEQEGEGWEKISIVERPRQIKDKKYNYFEFLLPRGIAGSIINEIKAKNYSALDAVIALTLRRKGSRLIFDLCLENINQKTFSILTEEFKLKLGITSNSRYTRWVNLEKDILLPAKKELTELNDLSLLAFTIDYTREKQGKLKDKIEFRKISNPMIP